jgi:twitching motility two-component system response regulator PilG
MIFLDIMMPRLDGYQTCLMLKSNAKYRDIPVIMLSSKDGLFDQARGQLAGANEYMTKPFTREELLRVVGNHVPVQE